MLFIRASPSSAVVPCLPQSEFDLGLFCIVSFLTAVVLFSVKVNFENKQSTGATSVILDVDPNTTCSDMKQLVMQFT